MMLAFTLSFMFIVKVQASDAVSLSRIDWRPLRDCLAGEMSANDSETYDRHLRARGSLFLLDQRKGSFNCPSPRSNDIAWVKKIGEDRAEITVLFEKENGALAAKRYEFEPSKMKSRSYIQIPGTEAVCVTAFNPVVKAAMPKNSLNLKIDSWPLKKTPTEGQRAKQTQRFAISNIEPDVLDTQVDLKEVSLPTNDYLLTEIMQEFASSVESMQDRFADLMQKEKIETRVKSCEQAAQNMREGIPANASTALYSAAGAAQNAAANLSSIFIKARPNHLTIKDLENRVAYPDRYRTDVLGIQ